MSPRTSIDFSSTKDINNEKNAGIYISVRVSLGSFLRRGKHRKGFKRKETMESIGIGVFGFRCETFYVCTIRSELKRALSVIVVHIVHFATTIVS